MFNGLKVEKNDGILVGGQVMQITKSRLKQIIKEEAEHMGFDGGEAFSKFADVMGQEQQGYDDTVDGQDPELDYEGYMTKSQLFKIGEYALKMHDMIEDGENLPEWMQSKIAQMAQSVGDIYSALEYDKSRGTIDSEESEDDDYGYQE
jgi:hypothetical protein